MKKISFWSRVKLAWYTYKNANRMPFKLVTGIEFETTGSLPPSSLETLGVKLWFSSINESGKKDTFAINPFCAFGDPVGIPVRRLEN